MNHYLQIRSCLLTSVKNSYGSDVVKQAQSGRVADVHVHSALHGLGLELFSCLGGPAGNDLVHRGND